MDPRPPVHFGPFPSSAEINEQVRADAARAMNCAAGQVAIVFVASLAIGLFALLCWSQLAKYEAALAACARV
jgi:hypothetical protein